MSCFIIPLVQAIATTTYRKHTENNNSNSVWKKNLPTLEKMLWGGTVMLLVDHAINAELTMSLREMLTIGLPMSAAVTALWAVWVLVRQNRTKTA